MLTIRALILSLLFAIAANSAAEGIVNINSADASKIAEAMTGIGLKRAEDIVAFREKNGRFRSIEDLVLVKGIGASTLDKNRDRISVE
ncbi:MAG: ComEA family DNA-binding protein [Gammaproteobacteria bacterium]